MRGTKVCGNASLGLGGVSGYRVSPGPFLPISAGPISVPPLPWSLPVALFTPPSLSQLLSHPFGHLVCRSTHCLVTRSLGQLLSHPFGHLVCRSSHCSVTWSAAHSAIWSPGLRRDLPRSLCGALTAELGQPCRRGRRAAVTRPLARLLVVGGGGWAGGASTEIVFVDAPLLAATATRARCCRAAGFAADERRRCGPKCGQGCGCR